MAERKKLFVPQFGTIKGGRLDGWHFHFLHFKAGAELRVVARCTPLGWPFPRDIRLDETHFGQLRAVPGSRAKRLDADKLITSAYGLEGLKPPAWIFEKTQTVRAVVKRTRGTRRVA